MASPPVHHKNSGANDEVPSGGNSPVETGRSHRTVNEDSSLCSCIESSEAGVVQGVEEGASLHSEGATMQIVESSEEGRTLETGDGVAARHATFADLPDEIMIKIMSYMTFCELVDVVQKVCSNWKRLAQDPELWYNKIYIVRSWCGSNSLTRKGDKTDREAVRTLYNAPNLRTVLIQRGAKSCVFRALTNCPYLRNLHIGATQKLSYSVMKALVDNCPKIHTLRISNHLLQNQKFVEALSQLHYLHLLHLEDYSMTDARILLRPLADGCPHLSEVDLGHMYYDMEDLAYFLHAKSHVLKYLGIRWTMDFRRCVVPLLTMCANTLERLELYHYDVLHDEAYEAFLALGQLHNLRVLTSMTLDSSLSGIVPLAFQDGGLSKLVHLDLWDGYGLDDDTVIAISQGCPLLHELRLRNAVGISDAAFSQIHHLKYLHILDLSACEGLGEDLMPCLAQLSMLRVLFMEEMDFSRLEPGLACILEMSGLCALNLNSSLIRPVPFSHFPGKLINLRELHVDNSEADQSALEDLYEQMAELQIYGTVRESVPSVHAEGDLNDDNAGDEANVGGGDGAVLGGGSVVDDGYAESYCASDSYSDSEDVDISLLFPENERSECAISRTKNK